MVGQWWRCRQTILNGRTRRRTRPMTRPTRSMSRSRSFLMINEMTSGTCLTTSRRIDLRGSWRWIPTSPPSRWAPGCSHWASSGTMTQARATALSAARAWRRTCSSRGKPCQSPSRGRTRE
ncbi:unnamed protein product, partial [Effrenium voratum]